LLLPLVILIRGEENVYYSLKRLNLIESSTSPATIDETVKVAKKFLEDNPDELKKLGQQKSCSIGRELISRFLNWPESRVNYSLQRLNLIESGTVSKTAINRI
jgi:hypothetical protein